MKKLAIVVSILLSLILISCSFDVKANNKNIGSAQSLIKKSAVSDLSKKTVNFKNGRGLSKMKFSDYKIHYQGRAVVLTYHNISTEHAGGITIKPERFESDLKMLNENGFNVITLKEMINAMNGKGTMPANAVVITFDDGIGSFYSYAYPLLQKYHMPATNFIISSRNETYMNFKKGDVPLSPDEITEMYNSGLIDIESHTNQSHEYVYTNSELKKGPKLTNKIYDKVSGTVESENDYEKRVIDDLNKSRELIKKYTGADSEILCFPFGIFNKKVIELAKKCGFNYFVTTIQGANKQDSMDDKIYRIRSGDAEISSEKLLENIINVGNNRKAH